MTRHYDHEEVQEFWQYVWDRDDVYALPEDAEDPTYVLGMFPYTSGDVHMGHVRNYAITDAYARYRRMRGDDVLHPMGWDAFGLPAENAALERYTDPESWTQVCISRMREQLEELGFGYDWSREITTCEPDYYRWNQWLFTRFYENDLVEYEAAMVNWCPDCETVLADAQVETDGDSRRCWRCETSVQRRELDQWFFTITDYAEELYAGLDDLESWPDGVCEIQRNWIGRQEGAEVTFSTPAGDVEVFTTRPETVYGATFLALSPSHDLVEELADGEDDLAVAVDDLREGQPGEAGYDGVDTGVRATHPLTDEKLPVYVAPYVLEDVGTGAVMGVPAHNERDHAFAREQGLPIEAVIEPDDGEMSCPEEPYTGEGTLRESDDYDGLESAVAADRLCEEVDAIEPATTYRLRDWLISRQRYWGTPIPIVHCEACGHVPVPDDQLPVELPEFVHTTGNPLAAQESFVETTCPDCGGPAERETDTMDTFVDSSWYFLRYLSPDLAEAPFDAEVAEETLPVDVYVGGEEHATLHLLYVRFFTKALADLGLLEVREPIERLVSQGTVLYDGEKMSASKGNVVAPQEYGAETTRLFVLSAAHPEQDFEWTANDVRGVYDLQQTLYGMVAEFVEGPLGRDERTRRDEHLEREIDRTIAAVETEYDRFRFHRAITEIQELARLLRRYREYGRPHDDVYRRGLLTVAAVLSPAAPHLAEELWNRLGGDGLVVQADWPEPTGDVSTYRLERRLVERTREDVRDIVGVADIDDPERIELVVAPAWQHRVHELVREADADAAAVVERVRGDDAIDREAEAAAYAADLAERATVDPVLSCERELSVLERAGWLLEDEFDATVTVRKATEDDALSAKASPGKPAIHIGNETGHDM
ncbi:leucine--tRNA ligase [Natrialbaceae archaeon AArc-T1-2]|uniref:leucine--tRNA ligase n=1 Tax=Natrialbaceae archaeon AArc-T1-2 TaxID=3053904 RepID=UPI00255B377E|nr:leucine--tRNA ligase [Natrialbaceae archaeon AArc-T1-2]WIV66295.1 leucine--tRNA ligase [Natrialbaceae archaeon AArc-T1-2]